MISSLRTDRALLGPAATCVGVGAAPELNARSSARETRDPLAQGDAHVREGQTRLLSHRSSAR